MPRPRQKGQIEGPGAHRGQKEVEAGKGHRPKVGVGKGPLQKEEAERGHLQKVGVGKGHLQKVETRIRKRSKVGKGHLRSRTRRHRFSIGCIIKRKRKVKKKGRKRTKMIPKGQGRKTGPRKSLFMTTCSIRKKVKGQRAQRPLWSRKGQIRSRKSRIIDWVSIRGQVENGANPGRVNVVASGVRSPGGVRVGRGKIVRIRDGVVRSQEGAEGQGRIVRILEEARIPRGVVRIREGIVRILEGVRFLRGVQTLE